MHDSLHKRAETQKHKKGWAGGSQHLSLGAPCSTDNLASPFLLPIYMDVLTGSTPRRKKERNIFLLIQSGSYVLGTGREEYLFHKRNAGLLLYLVQKKRGLGGEVRCYE